MTTTMDDHGKDQAQSQLNGIKEITAKLINAREKDNDKAQDEIIEEIQNDPLHVQVKGSWHNPGEAANDEYYEILLCTGGPAVRILGELDQYLQAHTAWIEYQDWGTLWTKLDTDTEESGVLLEYAQQFYFGE